MDTRMMVRFLVNLGRFLLNNIFGSQKNILEPSSQTTTMTNYMGQLKRCLQAGTEKEQKNIVHLKKFLTN